MLERSEEDDQHHQLSEPGNRSLSATGSALEAHARRLQLAAFIS